eukprot:12658241-Alexandrium_andersonii.AAC.1
MLAAEGLSGELWRVPESSGAPRRAPDSSGEPRRALDSLFGVNAGRCVFEHGSRARRPWACAPCDLPTAGSSPGGCQSPAARTGPGPRLETAVRGLQR